jgi:hypothetical protein
VKLISASSIVGRYVENVRGALGAAAGGVLLAASAAASADNMAVAPDNLDSAVRIASLDAAALQAELSGTSAGKQLLQVSGSPACGVDIYYVKFRTVGGAGEPTQSSGALLVPTGRTSACSGPRPIVLYAHGTQTGKAFNIANISDSSNTEGLLITAMFAAQGYIVAAPNYAGYDISTLGYHPFLNARQQSGEMIDMLRAGRIALRETYSGSATDNGELFVTGYSEGGFVAMATQRALQAADEPITAAAPMSGPYAVEAFGDTIFSGGVDLGSTEFAPLLTTSYQHAYRDIYKSTSDVYSPTYAATVETVLPSTLPIATIFADGLLPETALFDSTTPVVTLPGNPALSEKLTAELAIPSNASNPLTPVFDLGFGSPFLMNNDYRVSYAIDAAANPDGAVPTPRAGVPLAAVTPTQTLRRAFFINDLRNGNWAPKVPTLLCGGDQDPTVFFSVNTQTMAKFWSHLPAGRVTVLDVDAMPSGPFAAAQSGFQASQAQLLAFLESPAGGGLSATAAQEQLVQGFHTAVAPFCTLGARTFFSQFLGVSGRGHSGSSVAAAGQ